MDNNKITTKFGLSIFDISALVTIVFAVLKLCGVIAWSWWWILSPIVFAIGLSIIVAIIFVIIVWISARKEDND